MSKTNPAPTTTPVLELSRLQVISVLLTMAIVSSLLTVGSLIGDVDAVDATPVIDPSCSNTVQGSAFRDLDADGIKDRSATGSPVNNAGDIRDDPGEPGVTVTAYDTTGSIVDTATTAADGTYSVAVPDGEPVRIEFTWTGTWLRPGPVGSDSGTATQFAIGGTCDLDLGVVAPAQYCGDNPQLATTCYAAGAHNGANNTIDTLVTSEFEWGQSAALNNSTLNNSNWASHYQVDDTATPSGPNTLSAQSQTGSTFGLAWNRTSNDLFVAATLKVGTGYGPAGPGAIYRVPVDPATGAATGSPTTFKSFAASAACADTHTDDLDTSVLDSAESPADDALFDSVGKCSIGGLAMAHDDSAVFAMTLADRKLVRLSPASGATLSSYDAAAAPAPSCPNPAIDLRPYAVAQHDGSIYIGSVCSAESTGVDSDLRAYVHRLDEASATFSLVFDYPLASERSDWRAWESTLPNLVSAIYGSSAWYTSGADTFGSFSFAQPILSDLAFDGQQMVLGFKNRTSDQFTYPSEFPLLTANAAKSAGVNVFHIVGDGDVGCASRNADGSYTLSSATGCGGRTAANWAGSAADSNEFFADGGGPGVSSGHDEAHSGGLALVAGLPLVHTMTDPTEFLGQNAPRLFNNGGFAYVSNADGSPVRGYVHYLTPALSLTTFGKANGLGDVEPLCNNAPVELGNRIWLDSDGDGIQDPGEPPIAGVTVNLYDGSATLVSSATTDANGNYSFVADDAPNVSTTPSQGAVSGGLSLSETYTIRLDNAADHTGPGPLAILDLTVADQGTDTSDSDATLSDTLSTGSSYPEITVTPLGAAGNNDHHEDFGLTAGVLDLALAKTIVSSAPFGEGDEVEFEITVTNQGQVPVDSIEITDYIPAGFTFFTADNNDFSLVTGSGINGPAAVTADLAALAVGESNTLQILLTISVDTAGSSLVNVAEISSYDDDNNNATTPRPDHDSIADSDPANDRGGLVDSAADDHVDGDGTGSVGDGVAASDEDDSDPAKVSVTTGASIGDVVWFDSNGNGLQDVAEPGVQGVAVSLISAGGATIAATTTDALGNYLFADLAPGDYRLQFTLPAGHEWTSRNTGTNDELDSDVKPSTGKTPFTTLDPDEHDPSWDAGIWLPSSIGDRVWLDTDRDGIQDAGESGLAGVKTTLLDGSGNAVATTTTDTDGDYSFTKLAPGTYVVQFEQPTGMVFTTTAAGANNEQDSNADHTSGQTPSIVLPAGTDDFSWDAGVHAPQYDLTLVKTLASSNAKTKTATWRLTAENLGPDPATGPVVVSDVLPTTLKFVRATSNGATCSANGQTVTCSYGDLDVGESFDISIETTYSINVGEKVSNSASVVGPLGTSLEPQTLNNADSASLTAVVPPPALAITGSRSGYLVLLGLVLLTTGVVLVMSGRRRTEH
ncbi:MAG: SdrD B-like domain-containing protein [Acidimicrobiales bacterium]